MTLPFHLQNLISEGVAQVERHPTGDLSPTYQRDLYQAICVMADFHDDEFRAHLAFATAVRAFGVWEALSSDKALAFPLLEVTQQFLIGEYSYDEAYEYVLGYEQLIDYPPSKEQRSPDDGFGVLLALSALREALGLVHFEAGVLDDTRSNGDVEPDDRDTAYWGMRVASDLKIAPDGSVSKRRGFWIWWLEEAIPLAWTLVNDTTKYS